MRKGTPKPVIQKALVPASSKAFLKLLEQKEEWAAADHYIAPGPMQFTKDISIPITLSFL
jgi:hypothetical protein